MMRITSYGFSDIGRTRERNEDACLIDEPHVVFAVADGLGGLPEGARASRLAVNRLRDTLTNDRLPNDPRDLVRRINDEIVHLGRRLSPETGIGTTLTVARILDNELDIVHVGDSAIYRFTPGRSEKLTVDHTLEEEIRSRPDYVPGTPIPRRYGHVLTRCLGQIEDLEIDRHSYPLTPGDRILLCTDGITLAITPGEIHERILDADTPKGIVHELVELANERGGRDNATAIAVFLD